LTYQSRTRFFVLRPGNVLERDYWDLVEQQFALKHHGKLSLFEQEALTAEERAWWIRRLNKQNEDQNDQMSKSNGRKLPQSPGAPPIDV